MDFFIQTMIVILSSSAIILVSLKNRWGFILGLASQPFWLVSTINDKQYGMVLVTVIYTFSWSFGIYKMWIIPYLEKKNANFNTGR